MYNSHLIHRFLDKIPLAIYLANTQAKIIFFNRAAEALSGYNRQEVLGKAIRELPRLFGQTDNFPSSLPTKVQQIIKGEIDFAQAILRCQHKDGFPYHVESNYFCLKGQNKNPQGVLVYARDISQEVTTLKLQRIFPYIFDSMRQCCIIIDKDKKITHFNRATEKLTNISRKEAIGKNPRDVFPVPQLINGCPLDKSPVSSPELVLETGEALLDATLTTCWNGQIRELLVDIYPILDEDQEIMGAINFAKDITLFRTMEKELQKQEKLALIGQLAAATAHETRNPLAVAMGFLQLLEQGIKKNIAKDKQLSYLNLIKEELQLINKVTEEFLWLGKEKKDELHLLNINELIKNLIPILENKALSSELKLQLVLEPALPCVNGCPNQLKQIFLNLAQNSFQVLEPQKGRLKIKTAYLAKEQQVLISFSDNGPGMPEEVLEKIFDPFFTTNETGNGLGLFICKRIVDKHQGKIKAENLAEGGAEFIIMLPAYP